MTRPMLMDWTDDPAAVGLNRERFQNALARVEEWCRTDLIPGIALTVGRRDRVLTPWCCGRLRPQESDPLDAEAIFTVASITKPVVATLAMLLLEEGVLSLGEKVTEIVPEFRGAGRHGVRVRHLLSHTSGLPDLPPDDRELRRANAGLDRFLAEVCQTELLFPPGRSAAYSSCGFLLLGKVLERAAGRSLPELLRERIFEPLGMKRTVLGAPGEWFEPGSGIRFADVRVPAEQADGEDWNWNSRYWRTLGAAWGGMLSTIGDLAIFGRMMLDGGRHEGRRLLSPASVELATSNALAGMREIPEAVRRAGPWGLGWRLKWPAQGAYFGDLASRRTYGHWGATGTVLWVDPERELFVVVLSTQPQGGEGRYLTRLSNMILGAGAWFRV